MIYLKIYLRVGISLKKKKKRDGHSLSYKVVFAALRSGVLIAFML